MFWNKKKVEPVQEKKEISVSEMKIKYKLFDAKVKDYIKKHQAIVDKHIQRATELKLKGLDASSEIRTITVFQSKINTAEKRRAMLELQVEQYETMQFDKEFLNTISDMVEVLASFDVDSNEIDAVSKSVIDTNLKLAQQQEKLNTKMDEINSAFDSMDSLSGMDGYENAEKSINAIIDQVISDARLSNEATSDVSAQEIAQSISDKLKVEA